MGGEKRDSLLEFTLDGRRYALKTSQVERVLPACEITPLTDAPEVILGIINWWGRVIPVFDPRKRFRLPSRPLELEDCLIIARSGKWTVALLVDEVMGLLSAPSEETAAELFPALEGVAGVVKTPQGLVLIQDLDRFLSLEEERLLTAACARL